MATAEAELEVGGRTVRISSPGRVRGVPEATVSTPITWAEIDDVESRECTIATVPGRYARLGDCMPASTTPPTRWTPCWSGADRDGID